MVCHCNHYPNYTATHPTRTTVASLDTQHTYPRIEEVIENFQLTEKYDDKLTQLGELSGQDEAFFQLRDFAASPCQTSRLFLFLQLSVGAHRCRRLRTLEKKKICKSMLKNSTQAKLHFEQSFIQMSYRN